MKTSHDKFEAVIIYHNSFSLLFFSIIFGIYNAL